MSTKYKIVVSYEPPQIFRVRGYEDNIEQFDKVFSNLEEAREFVKTLMVLEDVKELDNIKCDPLAPPGTMYTLSSMTKKQKEELKRLLKHTVDAGHMLDVAGFEYGHESII